jgi:hypothetical protein
LLISCLASVFQIAAVLQGRPKIIKQAIAVKPDARNMDFVIVVS